MKQFEKEIKSGKKEEGKRRWKKEQWDKKGKKEGYERKMKANKGGKFKENQVSKDDGIGKMKGK